MYRTNYTLKLSRYSAAQRPDTTHTHTQKSVFKKCKPKNNRKC